MSDLADKLLEALGPEAREDVSWVFGWQPETVFLQEITAAERYAVMKAKEEDSEHLLLGFALVTADGTRPFLEAAAREGLKTKVGSGKLSELLRIAARLNYNASPLKNGAPSS